LRDRQPRGSNFCFQGCDILVINQCMIYRWDGVLPEQFFLRNLGAEIARAWAHVAMRELEPCAGKSVRKLLRVLVKASRNLFVDWIEPQREIGGEHRGSVML